MSVDTLPKPKHSQRSATRDKHPDKALSAAQVRTVTEPGHYCDGNCLYLVVDDNGAKKWVLRVTIHGRRHDLGLGSVRLVSLAEAREEANRQRVKYTIRTPRHTETRNTRPSGCGPWTSMCSRNSANVASITSKVEMFSRSSHRSGSGSPRPRTVYGSGSRSFSIGRKPPVFGAATTPLTVSPRSCRSTVRSRNITRHCLTRNCLPSFKGCGNTKGCLHGWPLNS